MNERTFAMIKPDAVAAKNSGKIIDMIEQNGFTILGMQKLTIDKKKAQEFYAVLKVSPIHLANINCSKDMLAHVTIGIDGAIDFHSSWVVKLVSFITKEAMLISPSIL